MLISRETDYALRILHSLLEGDRKSVGEIAKEELIPQQFGYKIMKKLSNAGLVEIRQIQLQADGLTVSEFRELNESLASVVRILASL